MLKKIVCIGLVLASTVGSACQSGIGKLTYGSPVSVGPTVYNVVVSNAAYAAVIYNSRNAWNVTNAANYIGDWSGQVTSSDCPTGPMQIGALAFSYSGGTCGFLPASGAALAFTDNATRSITMNLNYAWSLNPGPGEYDIQSVLTHEFGHVLGLGHEYAGVCGSDVPPSCAQNPGRETMGAKTTPGETCMRDLAPNDIDSANALYNNVIGAGVL